MKWLVGEPKVFLDFKDVPWVMHIRYVYVLTRFLDASYMGASVEFEIHIFPGKHQYGYGASKSMFVLPLRVGVEVCLGGKVFVVDSWEMFRFLVLREKE